jgi:predicted outer membrane repeat protein
MHRFSSCWTNTLTKLGYRRRQRRGRGKADRFYMRRRPQLEPLEVRAMLAVVTVSNDTDVFDGDDSSITALLADPGADGTISLREAIEAANNTSRADTIEFDEDLFTSGPATITLAGSLGQLLVGDDLTIDGPGADQLTIDADGNSRVFSVTSGVTATISGLTITGGHASGSGWGGEGGGIANWGTELTLDSVVVTNNVAEFNGGGVYSGAKLRVIDSTFDSNVSYSFGGAINVLSSYTDALIVENSTFVGNHSAAAGALGIHGYSAGVGTASIVNSTFSENTSDGHGGAIYLTSTGPVLTIANSTIYNNQADADAMGGGDGGGIVVGGGSIKLFNSIVAGNIGPYAHSRDIWGNVQSSSDYNLLGTQESYQAGAHGVVSNNPGLAPLGDYGGPTFTHALLTTSGAIDKGSDSLALDAAGSPLTTDQRGFARNVDSGATGPSGGTVDIGAYEFAFTGPIVVSTLVDEIDGNYSAGDLSLREALALAKLIPGADEITFAEALAGQTITLSDGQLTIDSDVSIVGPGADLTTIDADGNSRVFQADSGVDATISGLTITGGQATGSSGGGILAYGDVTLSDVVVADNTAAEWGGGIYVASTGSLSLLESTVDGNSATGGTGNAGGIAVVAGVGERLIVSNSTISNNTASGGFGGLYFTGAGGGLATGTIVNSTISQNSADWIGGFRVLGSNAHLEIVNSTIAYNSGQGSAAAST